MAEQTDNPIIGAFTALSEQISDLKATMEAKFDAQQRQLSRLEDRDEKIVTELADLKGKVYHSHDHAISELEEENKEFVTRREFNGGLKRVETVVQRGENLIRWIGGLVGASILGAVVAVVGRYMGWL